MTTQEALALATEVLRLAQAPSPPRRGGFLAYVRFVAEAAKTLTPNQRHDAIWFRAWVYKWSQIADDFERIVAADPMAQYRPTNPTMDAFHRSLAFTRYVRTGNRCGKTTAGYAEDYFCATGRHPYRPMPSWPASVLIVAGLPFSDYAPKVFEKKMLYGEDNNILSPMFPENGKWFYHYDAKQHIITLGCPECAERGAAQSCPSHHKKVTIALATSEKGIGVIEAFTVRFCHGDEHLPEDFYGAMKMRCADQEGASMYFTGTPLHGEEAWEATELAAKANGPTQDNRCDPEDPASAPLVELFTCTMLEGLVVDAARIATIAQGMDAFEREARLEGKPAPLAKHPVFDRMALQEMRKTCRPGRRGYLELVGIQRLEDLAEPSQASFVESNDGHLTLWEPPEQNAQYVVAVDAAAGLHKNDPSCADVLRMEFVGDELHFVQCAQFHAWADYRDYADAIMLLATWYNSACVVIELTGGHGRAVMLRLKRDLCYWNLFRDGTKPEYAEPGQDARQGVETNAASKPFMIGILQHVIRKGKLRLYCEESIRELVAYEQERTDSGLSVRYRGSGGSHDDRVMTLAVGVSTAISQPQLFDPETEAARQVNKSRYPSTSATQASNVVYSP